MNFEELESEALAIAHKHMHTKYPGGAAASSSSAPNTGGGSTTKPSAVSVTSTGTNPPAWATPSILAACGPGERLYLSHAKVVRAYPSRQAWCRPFDSKWTEPTQCNESMCVRKGDDSYTIPTPPAAKCNGSGWMKIPGGVTGCKGCPACKPEPKDGDEHENIPLSEWTTRYEPEGLCDVCSKPILSTQSTHAYAGKRAHLECDLLGKFHRPYIEPAKPEPEPEPKDGAEDVARKVISDWLDNRAHQWPDLVDHLTAAILADRAARPDLDKVRELCEWVVIVDAGSQFRILAREVLAQLEPPTVRVP